MARLSNVASPNPGTGDETTQKATTPAKSANRKRKFDWSTIDDSKEFKGFKLKAITPKDQRKPDKPSKKKRKLGAQAEGAADDSKDAPMSAEITQKNPFKETTLSDIHCRVMPVRMWEGTHRYRRFTINDEEFESGHFVFVRKTEEDHDTPNAIPQWFAKILEVRAGDAAHVYLRVFWAYRPEDLPGGRQPHHGESELIVSNHMEIIEAHTVESIANVVHWPDTESSEWPAKEQLFWRQGLDVTKPVGSQLTPLKTYCVDEAPCNPDEPLVYCPSCKGWLHAHCLEDGAVLDATTKANEAKPKGHLQTTTKQSKAKNSKSPTFTAEFNTSNSGKTRLTVTENFKGQKTRQWNVDIHCLLCKELIEKADEAASEDLASETPIVSIDNKELVDLAIITKSDLPTSAEAGPDPVASPATTGEQTLETLNQVAN
ncbi:hypothetical protein BKA66DRAFT_452279 [Pyrenochaeta sp. MPI-SDFR-AT-0127]|nr:hypothetical protein BKA66DRAFT_452279 [Pyrenochaeta sp. MPI-SDFR-AT-0127]